MPKPDVALAAREAKAKADARPKRLTPEQIEAERLKCADPIHGEAYFIDKYCQIYDNDTRAWIPFKLWPAQADVLRDAQGHKAEVILKARQNGLSWLFGDGRSLWKMLFEPIAIVLIFNQRDDEAMKLLQRIKDTYDHLPAWMKPGVKSSNEHEFELTNGSQAIALPGTTGGRSFAATYVVIDEADFIDDLKKLVDFARPTIELGTNQLVLLSTPNKEKPNSYFKQLYLEGRDQPESIFKSFFLSWRANPKRTDAWYAQRCEEAVRTDGALDSIYEQYPETDEQALSERSTDKRFPSGWISEAHGSVRPYDMPPGAPILNGLTIYRLPQAGHHYGIGADPAEGLPTSDDSVAIVTDADTGEECATWAGKITEYNLADGVAQLFQYYNRAPVLVERNNHGHTVIQRLRDTYPDVNQRTYTDGKLGWHTNDLSKSLVYTNAVTRLGAIRDLAKREGVACPKIIHNKTTASQLTSIDKNTLSAPEHFHDDYSVAFVLSWQANALGKPSMEQVPYSGLYPDKETAPTRPGSRSEKLDPDLERMLKARFRR